MSKCTYAGLTLEGHRSITFGLSVGVDPYIATVEVSTLLAERIVELVEGSATPGAATLDLNGDVFEEVYLVRVEPAQRYTRRLVLADRRWFWSRRTTPQRGYNVRRRVGDKYVDGNRIENARIAPIYKYEGWSVHTTGTPFVYAELLSQAIAEWAEAEANLIVNPTDLEKVPVDNFFETVNAAGNLSKVLALHGGLSIWVSKKGTVIIADKKSTQARAIEERPGQVIIGGGAVGLADRRFERPRSVKVLFDVEQELRFNYDEPVALKSVSPDPADPPLDMENVIPATDLETGRGRGNWQEISSYLEGLPSLPFYRPPFEPSSVWDLPTLRKYYMKPFGFSERFYGSKASFEGQDASDAFWQRVIGFTISHYRRTFRINEFWRDRVRQLKAYRSSNIDATTATRGAAQAFCDYTMRPSARSLFRRSQTNSGCPQVVVLGYAEDLDEGQPAPADIQIVDNESGVIRIYLITSASGDMEYLVPGRVDSPLTLSPNVDMDVGTFSNTVFQCGIKAEFKLAVILSATLNPGQYGKTQWAVDQDARDFTSSPALGEPMTVKIRATPHAIARFAWQDQDAEAIRRESLEGGNWSRTAISRPALNADLLDAISAAVARSIYEMFDATQTGSAAYPAAPGNLAAPFGSTTSSLLTINTDGTAIYQTSSTLLSQPVQWQSRLSTLGERLDAGLVLP